MSLGLRMGALICVRHIILWLAELKVLMQALISFLRFTFIIWLLAIILKMILYSSLLYHEKFNIRLNSFKSGSMIIFMSWLILIKCEIEVLSWRDLTTFLISVAAALLWKQEILWLATTLLMVWVDWSNQNLSLFTENLRQICILQMKIMSFVLIRDEARNIRQRRNNFRCLLFPRNKFILLSWRTFRLFKGLCDFCVKTLRSLCWLFGTSIIIAKTFGKDLEFPENLFLGVKNLLLSKSLVLRIIKSLNHWYSL